MVGAVHADSPEADAARAFFAKYVALEEAYNEKIADLYSDSAVARSDGSPL
jgi:hypothetical protein